MKKVVLNKWFKIIGITSVLLIAILFIPFYRGHSLTTIVKNRIEYLSLSEERQAVYDKMKIEYINIKSRITGTAPFSEGDVSNTDGIDVSDSDNYVRTFDIMKYTVELGIAPNTTIDGITDSSTFEGGVIKVRAKLPNQNSPILMNWEQDAWMQNVTYSNDKTEIYAEYHVPQGVSITNASQNLTFSVKINGYKKEVTNDMAPIFEVWMEGNKPDDASSNVESITLQDNHETIISGKVSLDAYISKIAAKNLRGVKGDTVGQYLNFGIGVNIQQANIEDSSLKGVEFPQGRVELTFTGRYRYRSKTGSSTGSWKTSTISPEVIEYGLNYEPKPNYYLEDHNRTAGVPCGRLGLYSDNFCVYDSGVFDISYENNLFTSSFTNFQTNQEFFPARNLGETHDSNDPSFGRILAGNVQIFIPHYDFDSDTNYDYEYTFSLDTVKYYDSNGQSYEYNASSDSITTNNSQVYTFSKALSKAINPRVRLYSGNSHDNEESSAPLGATVIPSSQIYPTDGPYLGGSLRYFTWNAKYVTFSDKITVACTSNSGFPCPTTKAYTYKYGILKTNPSEGLTSLEAINASSAEDFDWYSTTSEAKSHGKIAAIEIDDRDIQESGIQKRFNISFKVNENPENIGKVVAFYHKVIVYEDKARTKAIRPAATTTFKQAIYNDDGTLASSSTPRSVGSSLLIIGARASTSTTVTDVAPNGTLKSSYDTQEGEIHIKITPTLTTGGEASDNDIYSERATVYATLPDGLSYKMGSANKDPKRVTRNLDGTTTIEWEYNHWQVNHDAPEFKEITYTAEISASVENNTSLLIKSRIEPDIDLSDDDNREDDYKKSSYGVVISNLAGSRVSKEISKQIIEKNDSFQVTSTIGNNGDEELQNLKTIEILPTNHDENSSVFNGNYTTKILASITGQRFFYATDNISDIGLSEDKYGKLTIKDVDLENDSRWNEVQLGEEIPVNATAIASFIEVFPSKSTADFIMEISPNNNEEKDTYAFTMNMTCDNLQAAIKTNTVMTKVVSRAISGKAFIDENRNGSYDNDDTLLKGNTVKLLNEIGNTIATTQTDQNGHYIFENIEKSNYYVEFSIPNNYEPIEKGEHSKVNSDGKTDKITSLNVTSESELLEVQDINMGIQKIASKINVRYEEYQNPTNLFDSKSFDKYYGDSYNLDEDYTPTIPNNYELKEKTNNYTGTVSEKEINVIYYYQKKDSKLTSSIENTGTNEITSTDAKVSYDITYKVKITDYLGEATIKIIDTLPYEIDLEKSSLNGGTYDSTTKTITWIETRNIESTIEDEITISKNINLSYLGILPTSREMINSATGVITLDNNERSVSADAETDIKISGKIMVYYLEVDEENKELGMLTEPVSTTNLVGEEYTPIEKEFEGYELVKKPDIEEYTYQENEQKIYYKYQKKKVKVETIVHGIGGKIVGNETLYYGNNSTENKIIIEAAEGYQIDTIRINGEDIKLEGTKIKLVLDNFKEMKEDKVIEVTFRKLEEFKNPETKSIRILVIFVLLSVSFGLLYLYLNYYKHKKILK